MTSIREVLAAHREEILDRWIGRLRGEAFAEGLSAPELSGVIPEFLSSLGGSNARESARLSAPQQALVDRHLSNRLTQGSTLNEILTEFSSLSHCIAVAMENDPEADRLSARQAARLFSELHMTCVAATKIFNEQLLEDEQPDKRFARLLRDISGHGLTVDSPRGTLRRRLDEAVALIMRATQAHTAALLVFDAKSNALVMCASAGDADEHMEPYKSSLDVATFAGKVASHEEGATAIRDAALTELEVSDTLRSSGIHSLLGVPLSSGHALRGVLYVGVRENREFSASEVRRIERLGAALTLHLDNARLSAALEAKIKELTAEAQLRDRFVSILMHDLDGPLMAAKVDAQKLAETGFSGAQEIATSIIKHLAHIEEMVAGLVDAHRVRAGHRIPINIQDCDLSSLARDAVDELRAAHGDRFVLDADPAVVGMWSRDQLRRALWNLAMNGIRFGAAGAPLTISVRRGAEGAELAVHNDGPGLSEEDKQSLFRPFALPRSGRGDPPGWGLGLTLVWGCADAHGGRVEVESTPGNGTTVRLALPYDSRPYAE